MSKIDDILNKSVSDIDAEINSATSETLEERYEFCIYITYDFIDNSFFLLQKRIEQIAEHTELIFDYHFETKGNTKHELMYDDMSFYFNMTTERSAKDVWLFLWRIASIDNFTVARLPIMWINNWTGQSVGTNKMYKNDFNTSSQVQVMLKTFLPQKEFKEEYCIDLSRLVNHYEDVMRFKNSKKVRVPGILYNYKEDLYYTADNALEAWQKWIFIKEATTKYATWNSSSFIVDPIDHFMEFMVRWYYDKSFRPNMNYLTGILSFVNDELSASDIDHEHHFGCGAVAMTSKIRIEEDGKVIRL